jgi:hypothetical protein
MFSTNTVKVNPFEIYNTIQTNFTSIKNLTCFVNYTMIPPTDLITISNVTLDCVDKLGEMSVLFVKKINDSSISVSTIEKLQRMKEIHDEMINHINKFNLISSNISDRYTEICANNLNQDAINYIYYDIVNRHKLILYQIFDCIKRINVYVTLVKDKINL